MKFAEEYHLLQHHQSIVVTGERGVAPLKQQPDVEKEGSLLRRRHEGGSIRRGAGNRSYAAGEC